MSGGKAEGREQEEEAGLRKGFAFVGVGGELDCGQEDGRWTGFPPLRWDCHARTLSLCPPFQRILQASQTEPPNPPHLALPYSQSFNGSPWPQTKSQTPPAPRQGPSPRHNPRPRSLPSQTTCPALSGLKPAAPANSVFPGEITVTHICEKATFTVLNTCVNFSNGFKNVGEQKALTFEKQSCDTRETDTFLSSRVGARGRKALPRATPHCQSQSQQTRCSLLPMIGLKAGV